MSDIAKTIPEPLIDWIGENTPDPRDAYTTRINGHVVGVHASEEAARHHAALLKYYLGMHDVATGDVARDAIAAAEGEDAMNRYSFKLRIPVEGDPYIERWYNSDGFYVKHDDVERLQAQHAQMLEALEGIIGEAAFEGLPETKQEMIRAAIAAAEGRAEI